MSFIFNIENVTTDRGTNWSCGYFIKYNAMIRHKVGCKWSFRKSSPLNRLSWISTNKQFNHKYLHIGFIQSILYFDCLCYCLWKTRLGSLINCFPCVWWNLIFHSYFCYSISQTFINFAQFDDFSVQNRRNLPIGLVLIGIRVNFNGSILLFSWSSWDIGGWVWRFDCKRFIISRNEIVLVLEQLAVFRVFVD